MKMPKIKICGICSHNDALKAVELGADALGFNFYHKSKRYIRPDLAQEIARQIPKKIWKVGVFVDAQKQEILSTVNQVGLDTIQLHGSESPEFVSNFRQLRTIKAINFGDFEQLEILSNWLGSADYLLIDAASSIGFGGTGEEVDEELLLKIKSEVWQRSFLAGGLTPANVAGKVKQFAPYGVDVASGVEEQPGVKSEGLMARFIEQVRG